MSRRFVSFFFFRYRYDVRQSVYVRRSARKNTSTYGRSVDNYQIKGCAHTIKIITVHVRTTSCFFFPPPLHTIFVFLQREYKIKYVDVIIIAVRI